MANQTYGQQFGQNIGGIAELLQSLLTGGTAVDSGMRAGKAGTQALGNVVGQGPSPLEAGAKAILSPYQEGVKKAMKESGYNEAFEAKQAGVPHTHIEQQAGLSPDSKYFDQTKVQPEVNRLATQQQEQMNPTAPSAQPQQNQGNILQQLLGSLVSGGGVNEQGVYQPRELLGGLMRENSASQLQRQQSYSMSPGGAVQEARMKAEQVPLSQEQQMTMQAGINTATREGLNQANERVQANLTALQTQYDQENKIAPPWTKNPLTGRNARMQQLQDQIDLQQGAALQLQNKLNNWKPTKFSGKRKINFNPKSDPKAIAAAKARGLI
jgi:hypothetical protein